jgi:hypothetical protein
MVAVEILCNPIPDDWSDPSCNGLRLALFESGLMPMSLVVSEQAGHNLSAPGGIERLAEAVARGAACNTDLVLDVDFFQHANESLEEIRARFNIQPKSAKILELDPFGAMKLPPVK